MVLTAALTGTAYWYWSQPAERSGDRRIAQVAVSPSGRWFAAGSVSSRFAIWQTQLPDRAQFFRIPDATPRALAFNQDEDQLAIAHSAGLSLKPVQEMGAPELLRSGSGFRMAAFQPKSASLLAITDSGSIEWFGGARCCGAAPSAAFSPDGSLIATGGSWPALWMAHSGKLVARLTREGEFADFGPIDFDRVRGWVLMGSRDGRVYAWDLTSGVLRAKSPEPAGAVESLAILKSSPWIAFAMSGAPLHMWNADTGEMRSLDALPYSNVVAGPSRGSVLFGNYAGSVELWNAENATVISRFTLR